MRIENKVARFAIKFCLISIPMLVVFYYALPYYIIVLRQSLGLFEGFAHLKIPNQLAVVEMPFVILTSLVLAMDGIQMRKKIKFLLPMYLVFYLIDFSFIVFEIILPSYITQILVAQDFFRISLPIILWWIFANRNSAMFSLPKISEF